MSNITALLTGVCMYPAAGYPALPLCANDVQAVKKALIAGLNVSESNIMVCGHHGTATTKEFLELLMKILLFFIFLDTEEKMS